MTLTYAYADQTVVLGPLSAQPSPGSYDLCAHHAETLSAPVGWEVIRLSNAPTRSAPDAADYSELADEIRAIGFGDDTPPVRPPDNDQIVELGRRGHLRVIVDATRARASSR